MMLTIAKVKHPGRTKSAICNVMKRLMVVLVFGGKMNGMAKWKAPNTKINNASADLAFSAFTLFASLTFFNANDLKTICEVNCYLTVFEERKNVG